MTPSLGSTGQPYASVTVACRYSPPNPWNALLDQEAWIWQGINDQGGLALICPGHRYAVPPWTKMPPQGKRFQKTCALNLPANDGIDHVIPVAPNPDPNAGGGWYVPQGYDGCISVVVFQYTGVGFNEGSGDLTWRIKINQRYAKDYGAVQTQQGSLTTPYSGNIGQIILQSGNLVQCVINRSVASLGNENGGKILAQLSGWTWPR